MPSAGPLRNQGPWSRTDSGYPDGRLHPARQAVALLHLQHLDPAFGDGLGDRRRADGSRRGNGASPAARPGTRANPRRVDACLARAGLAEVVDQFLAIAGGRQGGGEDGHPVAQRSQSLREDGDIGDDPVGVRIRGPARGDQPDRERATPARITPRGRRDAASRRVRTIFAQRSRNPPSRWSPHEFELPAFSRLVCLARSSARNPRPGLCC